MKDSDKELARMHEEERLADPRMAYYKEVFKNSKRWTGEESLEGKKVIVYCEQGAGDIIHMARYFSYLEDAESLHGLYLYCPKSLHDLFVFECLDKENPELPEHDFHVLSLSLPFLVGEVAGEQNGPSHTTFPYLSCNVDLPTDLSEVSGPNDFRIGICWEGSPLHDNNEARCCPLKHFKPLARLPNTKLFCLQKYIHNQELVEDCEDLELYGVELNDFKDTANLISNLSVVVTIDTAVAHLAGAMNKRVHLLLPEQNDGRWGNKGDATRWYKSMKIWRVKNNPALGAWGGSLDKKASPRWGEALRWLHAELHKNR